MNDELVEFKVLTEEEIDNFFKPHTLDSIKKLPVLRTQVSGVLKNLKTPNMWSISTGKPEPCSLFMPVFSVTGGTFVKRESETIIYYNLNGKNEFLGYYRVKKNDKDSFNIYLATDRQQTTFVPLEKVLDSFSKQFQTGGDDARRKVLITTLYNKL